MERGIFYAPARSARPCRQLVSESAEEARIDLHSHPKGADGGSKELQSQRNKRRQRRRLVRLQTDEEEEQEEEALLGFGAT